MCGNAPSTRDDIKTVSKLETLSFLSRAITSLLVSFEAAIDGNCLFYFLLRAVSRVPIYIVAPLGGDSRNSQRGADRIDEVISAVYGNPSSALSTFIEGLSKDRFRRSRRSSRNEQKKKAPRRSKK